jgi:hypothetical protein
MYLVQSIKMKILREKIPNILSDDGNMNEQMYLSRHDINHLNQ